MKYRTQKAFTMIELIFVIVVISILSSIAVSKLAATRDDAVITKARTTVASVRSALATERQKRILRGAFTDVIDGEWVENNATEYGLGSNWERSGNSFTFTGPSGHSCIFTVSGNKLVKGTCGVSGMSNL